MTVGYTPTFIRQYKKLPEALQTEVKEKIARLQNSLTDSTLRVHKLKGALSDVWSFSVNYEYRILFEKNKIHGVVLLAVGNHDIYR